MYSPPELGKLTPSSEKQNAPQSGATAPTNQMRRNKTGSPSCPARKPLVVKMPVPIMLDTTSAVALTNPSCRISVAGGRGRDVVEVAIGIWFILAPHGRTELVRMLHTPARKLCP